MSQDNAVSIPLYGSDGVYIACKSEPTQSCLYHVASVAVPSNVSPLAAEEYSPAFSVAITVPPSLPIADSKDSLVRVEGS